MNFDGSYVAVYDSIADAVRKSGCRSIVWAINGKYKHAGGFVWIKEDDYKSGSYTIPKIEDCLLFKQPLVQLDLNGKLINKFNSRQEASAKTGILDGTIHYGLSRNGHYAMGYYWIYENDYNNGNYKLNRSPRKHKTTIVQLSLDGNFIKEWVSQSEAKKINGGNLNIARAVKEGKVAGCYRWMYKHEYEKMVKDMNKEEYNEY